MARPKKTDCTEMATTRIENAFWKLLETEKYSKITVLRISQESGVNRNSFYYHYNNMDDLMYQAFKHNTENEASKALISALLEVLKAGNDRSIPAVDMSILSHSRRIMLCARSESDYLRQLVNDFLKKIWLESFAIDEALLTVDEKLQIDFMFAGIVVALGSQEVNESPLLMLELVSSDIGKAMLSTLRRISMNQSITAEKAK